MADVKLSHRQRQALQTRRLIATAARGLFGERGYAATSIEAVAEAAGVAPRTVYAAFGTKKAILGAICEDWLTEARVGESMAAGAAEMDLARRLELLAAGTRRQWESDRGVSAMLVGAAASDADVARMLAGWRDDRAHGLAMALAGCEDQLGLPPDDARALLRALTAADVYWELVAGEGWTPDRYQSWLAALLVSLLVGGRPAQ